MGNQSGGKQRSKFKWHQAHSAQEVSPHAATDDRCANFSASTCPIQRPLLTTSSTADKLPLEKFHRLLDLVFWGKFLKLNSISLFVFFWELYRVSPFPVASERASRGRGENNNPEPPPAHVLILDMFTLSTLFMSTTVYTVYKCLQCLTTSYTVMCV